MAEVITIDDYRDKRAEALTRWLENAINNLSVEERERIVRFFEAREMGWLK